MLVKILDEFVVPLHRVAGPGALQAAGDRIIGLAAAVAAFPTQALLMNAGPFRIGTDMILGSGAMGLAEGVPAGNERNRLLVVHRHSLESLANVLCRQGGIRIAVRSFRVYVDQAHVVGAERSLKFAVGIVAFVIEPGRLRSPVRLVGFPDIRTAKGETESFEPHRFQRAVSGKDEQVGPGKISAVFLLDRPEQAARLVQVPVVRPAVERRKALVAGTAATPSVADAVRARGVPGHSDEKGAVVAVVGGPPVLRGGHHLFDVLLQRFDIQFLHRLGVVEFVVHRIGLGRILAERFQVQLIRPPGLIGSHFLPPLMCSGYGTNLGFVACRAYNHSVRKNTDLTLVQARGIWGELHACENHSSLKLALMLHRKFR